MTSSSRARHLLLSFAGLLFALALSAATYQPGSDVDLARRASMIVRATVVSQEARLESVGGRPRPFTFVTLARLETIRGDAPVAFTVRLPGGRVGDFVSWTAGTPKFAVGSEVVLLLERTAGGTGTYRLSEFGLSKFDLIADGEGRLFAVRSAFGARQDLLLADRRDIVATLAEKRTVPLRDAESFLAALRAVAAGRDPGDIEWREAAEGKD